MSESIDLQEPLHQVVAAFPDTSNAESALSDLKNAGIGRNDFELLVGPVDEDDVETRPVWFADTHLDLRRFRDALAEGGSVLSVRAEEQETVSRVNRVCHQYGAQFVFHFGRWATQQLHAPETSAP